MNTSSTVPAVAVSTPAQIQTWQIDASHTLVEFSVRHMMVSTVKGRFPDVQGTIVLDESDLSRSSVQVEIGSASITTHDPQRDAHLRSADFFDTELFPRITFRSTRVEPLSSETARVIGELTIKDVTRSAELEAELNGRGTNPWGKQVAGFSAHTTINRKDFGLNWNVALEAGGVLVADTIKINLEVEATA